MEPENRILCWPSIIKDLASYVTLPASELQTRLIFDNKAKLHRRSHTISIYARKACTEVSQSLRKVSKFLQLLIGCRLLSPEKQSVLKFCSRFLLGLSEMAKILKEKKNLLSGSEQKKQARCNGPAEINLSLSLSMFRSLFFFGRDLAFSAMRSEAWTLHWLHAFLSFFNSSSAQFLLLIKCLSCLGHQGHVCMYVSCMYVWICLVLGFQTRNNNNHFCFLANSIPLNNLLLLEFTGNGIKNYQIYLVAQVVENICKVKPFFIYKMAISNCRKIL